MNSRYNFAKSCTWLPKVLPKLYSASIQPRCYFLEVAIAHLYTSEPVNKLLFQRPLWVMWQVPGNALRVPPTLF